MNTAVDQAGGGRSPTRRDETMTRILAIATDLFAEKGFHATGVAELGRETGLGSGALYHYIGSKEELLFTILTSHIDQMVAAGQRVLHEGLTATEKLRALAREHMRLVAYRRRELMVVLRDLDSLTGERREEMLRRRDAAEEIWNEVVRTGQRDGELGPLDPVFVKVALGALNYSALWYQVDGQAGPEEMGDRIIAMMLGGRNPMVPD